VDMQRDYRDMAQSLKEAKFPDSDNPIGMWPCSFLRVKEFPKYRQRSWPEGRVKLD